MEPDSLCTAFLERDLVGLCVDGNWVGLDRYSGGDPVSIGDHMNVHLYICVFLSHRIPSGVPKDPNKHFNYYLLYR